MFSAETSKRELSLASPTRFPIFHPLGYFERQTNASVQRFIQTFQRFDANFKRETTHVPRTRK